MIVNTVNPYKFENKLTSCYALMKVGELEYFRDVEQSVNPMPLFVSSPTNNIEVH